MAEMDKRFQQILSWQQMDQNKAISQILQEVRHRLHPVGPRDLVALETWDHEPPGIAIWSLTHSSWGHASHPE